MEEAQTRQAIRTTVTKSRHNLLQAAGQAWFDLDRACRTRMEQTLGVEGYHRVRHGPWKRCLAGALSPCPPRAETSEESRWLVEADAPMVGAARQPWIGLLVGSDPQLIEEIGRSADEVRDELAGDDHRPDVRLLAERAAVAWLAREYADHLQRLISGSSVRPRMWPL